MESIDGQAKEVVLLYFQRDEVFADNKSPAMD
jgi:hypothetical protein